MLYSGSILRSLCLRRLSSRSAAARACDTAPAVAFL